MDYVHSCSCTTGGEIEDMLQCAPCPPPFLSYIQLKMTAIGKLCKREVCSIARRCNMSESSELTTDCPVHDTQAEVGCNLFCIIIIASVLSVALLISILIIVVYKRRSGDIKQDAINVVFNDTDSETSGKSSDRGSSNILEVHADCHYENVTTNEKVKSSPDVIEHSQSTKENDGNFTSFKDNDPTDSPVIKSGLRSRSNGEKNDTCIVAKL
ncbi:uncharacterized protein LOC132718484 [Ruditapes philippinarum]|uniref:uncharacterized protein LOC132718484 n=1 Tax=Ruditapes philippinarum TaxID=129788 RepID=UPI00295A8DBA|nr:uncharacterized protein LOC132718484 [Ruditapes philippinarum]